MKSWPCTPTHVAPTSTGCRLRKHLLLVLLCFQITAVLVDSKHTLKQGNLPTTVEQWSKSEGVWQGPTTVNPSNVTLWADFTIVSTASKLVTANSTSTVRGFWDGNCTFRVRFMPSSVGNWTWRTRSKATSLDGHAGSFTVTAPVLRSSLNHSSRSRRDVNNHGPVIVRAVENSTSFEYADGTPFHSIGTTVYGLFGGWGGDSRPNVTARTLQSLSESPFNKVRVMLVPVGSPSSPSELLPYLPKNDVPGATSDLTRFNPVYWQIVDSTVESLLAIGVQVDVILFNLYQGMYPQGLACLGGSNASSYDLTPDYLYLEYAVARLGAYRNVWWSMSNEWSQSGCKWDTPPTPTCPGDNACGPDGSNPLAHDTPIWDQLFLKVDAEDQTRGGASSRSGRYQRLMSIHNNGWLYNYSQPWITHFSVQHTHNRPQTLWDFFGRKPFVWDEVKYEGNDAANWGSLSGPQMVHRFWWGAAVGAYAGHGEVLNIHPSVHCGTAPEDGGNSWSGGGGYLCGQAPERIAWFRDYIDQLPLPWWQCVGDDDGFVRTLTCGEEFIMFQFYNGHPYVGPSFHYISLPINKRMRQDLVQPWEMRKTLIWAPPNCTQAASEDLTSTFTIGKKGWTQQQSQLWGLVSYHQPQIIGKELHILYENN